MENFFNYITQPMKPEDVDIWFRINNIIPEKMDLYYDFTFSLYYLIVETYLGDYNNGTETKINMTDEDKKNHFQWCWKKIIENFNKESIIFNDKGEHLDYFLDFFMEIFYDQKEDKIKNSIGTFFSDVFDRKKPFTKSDLDMISSIYKSLDKNILL
jgi:hypothetical protein